MKEKTKQISLNANILQSVESKFKKHSLFTDKKFSMNKILEISSFLLKSFNAGELIYLGYSGSRLFGTFTDSSDYDLIVLFKPSLDDLILKRDKELFDTIITFDEDDLFTKIDFKDSKTKANDKFCIDLKFISIHKFIEMLARGDINSIDLLFSLLSDVECYKTKDVNLIIENYDSFLTNSYLGMIDFAIKQVEMYFVKGNRVKSADKVISLLEEHPYKKIEEIKDLLIDIDFIEFKSESIVILNREFSFKVKTNFALKSIKKLRKNYGVRAEYSLETNGIDYKAISHALRTLDEVVELRDTGRIIFPLAKAEEYLEIKKGNIRGLNKDEIVEFIYSKYDSLKSLCLEDLLKSKKHQNKNVLDKIMLDLYK